MSDDLTKSGKKFSSPAGSFSNEDIDESVEELKKRRAMPDYKATQGDSWEIDSGIYPSIIMKNDVVYHNCLAQ